MPFIDVESSTGRTTFNYTICTPATAQATSIDKKLPTLLFIHPVSIGEHIYHSQFADPQLRRFNLVSFDLRGGHGETTGDKIPSNYGQNEAAEDTMKLMDALQLPPCHVVGMSAGTIIATQLAVSYPNRVLSLFLISHLCLEIPAGVAEGHQEVYDLWCTAFPNASTVLMDTVYDAGFGNSQYMYNNKLSPLIEAMHAVTYPVAMKSWGFGNLDVFRTMNLHFYTERKSHPWKELKRIAGKPVKIIYGTDDVAYSQSYSEEFVHDLQEAGVDASLYVVSDGPHYLAPDYGDEINPLLHDFIVQSDKADIPPAPEQVVSPWEDVLRSGGWTPEIDSFDDDFTVHHRHVSQSSLDKRLPRCSA